jgi:hypothetical protein
MSMPRFGLEGAESSECEDDRGRISLSSEPLLVAASGAARLCSMGTSTWRRMDHRGAVPRPVTFGRRRLWSVSTLRRWADLGCPGRAAFEARASAK